MNSLKIAFVLVLVALAKASPRGGLSESSDEELGRAFIECARKAILTGIPEINVPSHNPLVLSIDVNQDYELADISGTLSINNVTMEDIPVWEVREFELLESNDQGVDIFDYSIYWPKMTLKLHWQLTAKIGFLALIDNEGDMTLEYDHVTFDGLLNFTKPGSGRKQTINDLSLDISVLGAQLNVTNLGPLGDVLNEIGGPLLADLMNNNPANGLLGPGLKFKINRDWMDKPERLNVLIAKCKE